MHHFDTKQLARFERIDHRITGDHRQGCCPRAGYEKEHVVIDDATRLAYVEFLPDEEKATTRGFLARAVGWFSQMIVPATGERTAGPWISNPFVLSPTRPAPTARLRGMASGRLRLLPDPLPEMGRWDALPDHRGTKALASSFSGALQRSLLLHDPRWPQPKVAPDHAAR